MFSGLSVPPICTSRMWWHSSPTGAIGGVGAQDHRLAAGLSDAGGGTRTPDPRTMIPARFGSTIGNSGPGGHAVGHNCIVTGTAFRVSARVARKTGPSNPRADVLSQLRCRQHRTTSTRHEQERKPSSSSGGSPQRCVQVARQGVRCDVDDRRVEGCHDQPERRDAGHHQRGPLQPGPPHAASRSAGQRRPSARGMKHGSCAVAAARWSSRDGPAADLLKARANSEQGSDGIRIAPGNAPERGDEADGNDDR